MKTRDVISLISRIRQKVNGFIVSELSHSGIDGIVVSHGDIIYALFQNQKMTMAEIADKISKDKSTVTALINKLVRLGYVTKERDTGDSRVVYVTLTSNGYELKPIFEAISHKVLEVFYLNISQEEKEELIRILSKIDQNL
ncbi:MarR family transcriptional regulator [Mobilitalea sibirica]|uniref:MarR family transcriptional regulator n=1 Tax=Mobilitalea sibirica TaxID=1462919 RepID=A0A8J7KZC7_9FIRM|nr:MarR family transcriptional regulator [Mobilitalea sibirica]MBH1939933.1 MarR family transcriptional regulator [Mobilitalea sibirica]